MCLGYNTHRYRHHTFRIKNYDFGQQSCTFCSFSTTFPKLKSIFQGKRQIFFKGKRQMEEISVEEVTERSEAFLDCAKNDKQINQQYVFLKHVNFHSKPLKD